MLCKVCGSLAATERERLIDYIEERWGPNNWSPIPANPVPLSLKNAYHDLGHPKDAAEARGGE